MRKLHASLVQTPASRVARHRKLGRPPEFGTLSRWQQTAAQLFVASQKAWTLAQLIGTRFPTFSCMKMELPDIRGDDRTPLVESLLAIIRINQAVPAC